MPYRYVLCYSLGASAFKFSHSILFSALACQKGGLCVLKEDEMWVAAEQVWYELPSSRLLLDISSLFLLQRTCLTHEATMASLVAAAPFMSAFERISMRRRRACAARMERYSEHLS